MKGITSTDQDYLERLSDVIDELEGYPSQGVYADGTVPPPGVGITERHASIVKHPVRDEYAYRADKDVITKHRGKRVRIRDQDTDIDRDPVDLDDTWDGAREVQRRAPVRELKR
jgi:hypothetical protein